MKNPSPLTDQDGEVRELTENDFKQAISFNQLPESLRKKLIRINNKKQMANRYNETQTVI